MRKRGNLREGSYDEENISLREKKGLGEGLENRERCIYTQQMYVYNIAFYSICMSLSILYVYRSLLYMYMHSNTQQMYTYNIALYMYIALYSICMSLSTLYPYRFLLYMYIALYSICIYTLCAHTHISLHVYNALYSICIHTSSDVCIYTYVYVHIEQRGIHTRSDIHRLLTHSHLWLHAFTQG